MPSPTTPDRPTSMAAADAKDPSVILSEAAEKAYMCYQRSAAQAAAHQSTAEPAVEKEIPLEARTAPCIAHLHTLSGQDRTDLCQRQVSWPYMYTTLQLGMGKSLLALPTQCAARRQCRDSKRTTEGLQGSIRCRQLELTLQEAGQEQQKADVEASAPALGNSHRSRKRQMKQAASQATSQEFTPGKRRRREYERLLQYTRAISDASKPEGSARKRQKPAQEATPAKDQRDKPAKKQRMPRRKSAGWEYVVGLPCPCTPYPLCTVHLTKAWCSALLVAVCTCQG